MAKPIDLTRVRAAEERIAARLCQQPELAARTAQFLADNPSVARMETLMVDPFEKPTQLRLPRDLLERAEALVPVLADDPEVRALGRLTKTAVLRLAVLHGLEALEKRYRRSAEAKGKRR
jgi:hypothetical protein